MGIKGLMKLLTNKCPSAIREQQISSYFGRVVAIDASMCLYQFLIAVRQSGPGGGMLTNENGDVTSHLSGMFYRTIKMLGNGIKPVYVFDGKPPSMKGGELLKRKEQRDKAEAELKTAQDAENQEEIEKFSRRLVHVSRDHTEEAKKLLRLMGVPVVEAPTEAEAQCAILTKEGKVFATSTEDMDALTFGTPLQLRYMMSSSDKKQAILEIDLSIVLRDLELDLPQFIDLCILCGCDYTNTIRGVGPLTALKLIQQHKDIEHVIASLSDKKKVPEDFHYVEARKLFIEPDVAPADSFDLTFRAPDEEGLIEFLCNEKCFSIDRIKNGLAKLKDVKQKSSQKRIDSFFNVTRKAAAPVKRKTPTKGKASSASKKKRK